MPVSEAHRTVHRTLCPSAYRHLSSSGRQEVPPQLPQDPQHRHQDCSTECSDADNCTFPGAECDQGKLHLHRQLVIAGRERCNLTERDFFCSTAKVCPERRLRQHPECLPSISV